MHIRIHTPLESVWHMHIFCMHVSEWGLYNKFLISLGILARRKFLYSGLPNVCWDCEHFPAILTQSPAILTRHDKILSSHLSWDFGSSLPPLPSVQGNTMQYASLKHLPRKKENRSTTPTQTVKSTSKGRFSDCCGPPHKLYFPPQFCSRSHGTNVFAVASSVSVAWSI